MTDRVAGCCPPTCVEGGILLSGIAAEIGRLFRLSQDLQIVVSEAMSSHGAHTAADGLQNLDQLTQTLGELELLLQRIAHVSPASWLLDPGRMTSQVMLNAVRSRLLGEVSLTDPGPGALELL